MLNRIVIFYFIVEMSVVNVSLWLEKPRFCKELKKIFFGGCNAQMLDIEILPT